MNVDALFRGQPPDELGERLHALKQEGCAILTTGKVPTHVSAQATRKQLGYPDQERIRILALTEATNRDVSTRLPEGCVAADPHVHVIGSRSSRDTATASTGATGDEMAPVSPKDGLADFQARIVATARHYESERAFMEGGEFRLVVDSLKWLLDEFGVERVEDFVCETAMVVRDVSGMAHYHLPVPSGHEMTTRLLETGCFDGHVDLLHIEGWSLQKWHFDDFDELPWLKL